MRTIKALANQHIAIGSEFKADVASFLIPDLIAKNVVLITGRRSFQASAQSKLLTDLLEANQVKIVRHLISDENPQATKLKQDSADLPAYDCILAIGGGSVVDTAKKLKHDNGGSAPLFVIYSRFGSGTICTPFFVYDNHEFKIGGHDPQTVPDRVYVSLELMAGLTAEQRTIGVSDILAHAAESYLSTAGNASLKARARSIIEQLDPDAATGSLERLVSLDIEAGLIESECLVLVPHALGHYLTYTMAIPHGIASIITLPNYMGFLCKQGIVSKEFTAQVCDLAQSLLANYQPTDAVEVRQKLQNEVSVAFPLIQQYMPFALELSPVSVTDDDIRRMLDVTS